jgi:hypothetical protein
MKVSVLDLESGKVVRQYPVGRSPHGIYVHKPAKPASANAAAPAAAPAPAPTQKAAPRT